jgi:predicted CXXCH cytochrome family protein
MKVKASTAATVLTLGVIVLGILATALMSGADGQDLSYMKTAKYITSAKCKMCHRTQYNQWADTQHAKNATVALPADAPPDQVYRYSSGYNSADGTSAEKGTACEACHGPGSAHFAASMDTRKALILNPDNLTTEGQKVSLCGRCHGQYTVGGKHYADGFLPGDDLFKLNGFTLDPIVAGKPMQQLNEMAGSKHFANGVYCYDCHVSHGENAQEHLLRQPIVDLCLGCHSDKTKVHDPQDVIASLAAHQPAAPAGATCATCHMPQGAHTFAVPAKQ